MPLGEPVCPHCGGNMSGGPSPFLRPPPVARPPALCPVCQGRGTVAHGFYLNLDTVTNMAREECRACRGRGVL